MKTISIQLLDNDGGEAPAVAPAGRLQSHLFLPAYLSPAQVFTGDSGDNTFLGVPGDDTFDGQGGTDTVSYENAASGVTAALWDFAHGHSNDGLAQTIGADQGTDTLISIENLTGSAFGDTITGDNGANRLKGGDGDDTLMGLSGPDTIDGGPGNDTAVYNSAQGGYAITRSASHITITGGGDGTDTLTSIENLQFTDGTISVSSLPLTYWDISSLLVPLTPATENVYPGHIAPIDVDGDGDLDLIIPLNGSDDGVGVPLAVMLNDGTGHFTDGTATVFPGAVPNPLNLNQHIIADFNGDGRNDVIFGDIGHDANPFPGYHNTLLLSSGAHGFVDASANLPAVIDYTHSVAVGDINGDGFLDIYIGNVFGGTPNTGASTGPYFLLNDGQANFTRSDALPAAIQSRSVTHTASLIFDANGDGKQDLLLGDNGSMVLLNPGGGDFTNATSIALPEPVMQNPPLMLKARAIDLNGDGALDVIATYGDSPLVGHALQILINDGTGHFTDDTANRLPAGLNGPNNGTAQVTDDFTLADINGDGYTDLVAGQGMLAPVFLNDGTGHFIQLPASFLGPQNLASNTYVMDANGDGRADIFSFVARHNVPEYADIYALYLQEDTGPSQTGTSDADALLGTGIADTLNGAGGDDVLFGGAGDDTLVGGPGNDYLNGGAGKDTADYSSDTGGITVNLAAGTVSGPDIGTDTLVGIEIVKGGGGVDTMIGSDGNDSFALGDTYTAADHIDGGAGTNDQIQFDGDSYGSGVTLSGTSITNIEAIALAPGHDYVLTTTENFVNAKQTFTFWSVNMGSGNHVTLICDGDTDGHYQFFLGAGNDSVTGGGGGNLFYGEGGQDSLIGGNGTDIFAYRGVSDSTGAAFDLIRGFTTDIDKFKLTVGVGGVDSQVNGGSLSQNTFDTDIAGLINNGNLQPGHAVLFHPTSGSYAADSLFLVVDANGQAGYQAGQDYVFNVTGSDWTGLSATDFTT